MSNSLDPTDYSLPGSTVHGILQARVPEWVAMPSSRGSAQPRDQTPVSSVSCIGKQVLYHQSHPIYLFILGCAAWHCGILGWNPRPLHWKCRVLTTRPPWSLQPNQILKWINVNGILALCHKNQDQEPSELVLE